MTSAWRQSTASGLEHAGEVAEGVAVLPGRHVTGKAAAHLVESSQVVRRHRFFEPGHPELLCHRSGRGECLLGRVAAVGIDIELSIADHLAGQGHPVQVPLGVGSPGLANLDLDPWDLPLLDPSRNWARVVSSS